jgi:hypothetical protein
MRRLQARGIFAALENEELNVPPVEEAPVELPNHSESVEADLADLNAEHADIAEHDAQIDEAEETVEALEAIREQLIEADKEGGLSRSGAAILKISLEHMYGRLGLASDRVVPAMESFGGAASRQESTQIALETIGETISKVWAAIVEAAKKAWEWIKGWYNKLFDTNTKVTNRAKALKEAAAKLGTDAPKTTEIQNESLTKALMLTEHGGSAEAVLSAVEKFAGEFSGGAGKYFANLEKLANSVKEGHAVDLRPEEMSLGLKHVEGDAARKIKLSVGAGSTVFASDELPGGKYFVSAWSGKTEGSFAGMAEGSAAHSEKALPVADKALIEKIAEAVESISGKVASTKSDLDAAGKVLEALIASGEAHMKAAGKEQDEQSKASVELARVCQKLITGAATSANKYLLDTCQSMLAWGEQSVSAHTGTALGNAAEKVGEKVGAAADAVKEKAGAAADAVKGAAGAAADKVKGAVNSAASKVADKTKKAE